MNIMKTNTQRRLFSEVFFGKNIVLIGVKELYNLFKEKVCTDGSKRQPGEGYRRQ